MAEITGVTFKEGGKVYYFAPSKNDEYVKGSGVIVETARGVEYATVVIPRAEVGDDKLVSPLKPILRKATEQDTENYRRNSERRAGALDIVKQKAEEYGLDMKPIDCEFAFDGSKAVFYYTAPKRVDFRELVKDLSSHFRMRIELRQVGLRDEIQMLGGLAPCGRECCCASCLPELKKVTIKMAKNQGLSLNPTKISGLCGRLMCCLAYENEYYQSACKCMPKLGAEVSTPEGVGTVVNLNMLKMQVRVKIEDKTKDLATYKDFALGEVKFKRSGNEDDDAEIAEFLAEFGQNGYDGEENEVTESDNEPENKPESENRPENRSENGGKNKSGKGFNDGQGDRRRQNRKNGKQGNRGGGERNERKVQDGQNPQGRNPQERQAQPVQQAQAGQQQGQPVQGQQGQPRPHNKKKKFYNNRKKGKTPENQTSD